MGNFSYISKNKGCAVLNPWISPTLCEIQYLENGMVIEKMRGIYNGYGAVQTSEAFRHFIRDGGNWKEITDETRERMSESEGMDMWVSRDWGTLVDMHFDTSITSGFAIWHLRSMEHEVPEATERSADDPDQGDDYDDDEVWE